MVVLEPFGEMNWSEHARNSPDRAEPNLAPNSLESPAETDR
jgi:hypothetical protein